MNADNGNGNDKDNQNDGIMGFKLFIAWYFSKIFNELIQHVTITKRGFGVFKI